MAAKSKRKLCKLGSAKGAAAKKNLDLLCDLQTFLSIPCILPMLRSLNVMVTYAQGRDVYINDYVNTVKLCILELQARYVEPRTWNNKREFPQLFEYTQNATYVMELEWFQDLQLNENFLNFRIAGHHYPLHTKDSDENRVPNVSMAAYELTLAEVKANCTEAAIRLIKELKKRFPHSEIMADFSIFYPQFWVHPKAEVMFDHHLKVLKKHFGPKVINGEFVAGLLSSDLLDEQTNMFIVTMKSNHWIGLEKDNVRPGHKPLHPLSKIWAYLYVSVLLRDRLSEFIKGAQIAICSVIGSVEDERTFSTLSFLKSKLRNRLTSSLDPLMRIFSQEHFPELEDFPYGEGMDLWIEKTQRRGAMN
jgi:hypothetical protein